MDDLLSRLLKSGRVITRPKQPNLGEMNRSLDTATSRLPKPTPIVPKQSALELPAIKKYSDVITPLPKADNIYTIGNIGSSVVKDTRTVTYVNNNYAGDDYVD